MVRVLFINFNLRIYKIYFLALIVSCNLCAYDMIALNKDEIATLEKNGEVLSVDKISKKGFIVFYIDENIDVIFNQLINFSSYPKYIDDIDKVVVYYQDKNTIKAHIFVDTFFISFSNWVVHNINKKKHIIKWHLDNTYKDINYFKKMNGFWSLKKINNNKTMVFYSNDLEFKSYIPDFIKNILAKQGLYKATLWIRNIDKSKS